MFGHIIGLFSRTYYNVLKKSHPFFLIMYAITIVADRDIPAAQ